MPSPKEMNPFQGAKLGLPIEVAHNGIQSKRLSIEPTTPLRNY